MVIETMLISCSKKLTKTATNNDAFEKTLMGGT